MTCHTKICSRCVLPATFPGIRFDEAGVCSVCREHERRWKDWDARLPERRRILARLCADARRKHAPFDALVPLSGGKDSIYCLYLAVRELKLRCLAVTLDNGYLSDQARLNIERACRKLGVEHICYRVDPLLMNDLFALFMRKTGYFCSACMRGIGRVTDLAADLYRVPLVLGGSSARTELPLTPEMFQPGPLDYFRNVLRGEPLADRCRSLLQGPSLRRRLGYRLFWWGSQRRIRCCAFINLPDYMEWDYERLYQTIQRELDWKAGEEREHSDCAIHPVSVYVHNRRFPGLEIRRLTLARLIQAGQMTRDEALRQLESPEAQCPESALAAFLSATGLTRDEFDRLIDLGPRHLAYRTPPGRLWEAMRKVKRFIWSAAGIRKESS